VANAADLGLWEVITGSDGWPVAQATIAPSHPVINPYGYLALPESLRLDSIGQFDDNPLGLQPIPLGPVSSAVLGGSAKAAKTLVLGAAEPMLEVADVAQGGLKTVHGILTGESPNFAPLSAMGAAADQGASTLQLLLKAGDNALSVNPVYAAGKWGLSTGDLLYDAYQGKPITGIDVVAQGLLGAAVAAGGYGAGYQNVGIRATGLSPGPLARQRGAITRPELYDMRSTPTDSANTPTTVSQDLTPLQQPSSAIATQVYDVPTASENTGTIWDSIQRISTYGDYPGTLLPKAYITTIEGKDLFIAPNATKHVHEEITSSTPSPLRVQASLHSMHEGIADIIRNNQVEFGKIYVSQDGWEIIFAPPRANGELPAIKHARKLGY
jgi:hypothetical protein